MKSIYSLFLALFILAGNNLEAQVIKRMQPKEWDNLVYGAKFMDRFLPMTKGQYGSNIWGGV